MFPWRREGHRESSEPLAGPKGAPGELERDWGQGLEGQEPGNGFPVPEGSDGWEIENWELLAGRVGRGWAGITRAAGAAPGSLAVPKARLDIGAGSSLGQWEVSLPMAGVALDEV